MPCTYYKILSKSLASGYTIAWKQYYTRILSKKRSRFNTGLPFLFGKNELGWHLLLKGAGTGSSFVFNGCWNTWLGRTNIVLQINTATMKVFSISSGVHRFWPEEEQLRPCTGGRVFNKLSWSWYCRLYEAKVFTCYPLKDGYLVWTWQDSLKTGRADWHKDCWPHSLML